LEEIAARTYAWNGRKRQFTREQIGLAAGVLEERGWLGERRHGAGE
jgi:hypothetical protein